MFEENRKKIKHGHFWCNFLRNRLTKELPRNTVSFSPDVLLELPTFENFYGRTLLLTLLLQISRAIATSCPKWLRSLDLQSEIDFEFVAYENRAIVSVPIKNVQSQVTMIR